MTTLLTTHPSFSGLSSIPHREREAIKHALDHTQIAKIHRTINAILVQVPSSAPRRSAETSVSALFVFAALPVMLPAWLVQLRQELGL